MSVFFSFETLEKLRIPVPSKRAGLGELFQRRIVDLKPIQSYNSLTDDGKEIAKRFNEIKELLM